MSTLLPPRDEFMSEQEQKELGIYDFFGEIEQLGEDIATKMGSDPPSPKWPRHVIVFTRNWGQIWDYGLIEEFADRLADACPGAKVEAIEDGGNVGIFAITMTTEFVNAAAHFYCSRCEQHPMLDDDHLCSVCRFGS